MAPQKKNRRNCMVLFCKNKYSTPELTYFSLTKKRHDPWMRALGRDPNKEVLSQSNLVCSDHFVIEDIEVFGNKKKLREGAVPKLNLGLKSPNLLLCRKKLDFATRSTSRSSFPEMKETSHVEIPCTSSCRLEDTIESSTEPTVTLWEDGVQEEIIYKKQSNDGNIGESEFVEFEDQCSSASSTVTLESVTESVSSFDFFIFFFMLVAWCIILMKNPPVSKSPFVQQHKKRKLDEIVDSFTSTTDSEGLKHTPKKIRRDLRTFHNYCVSPRKMNVSLKEIVTKKTKTQQFLYSSKRRIVRLQKKIIYLKDVVVELRKKRLLSNDAILVLEKSYAGIPFSIMKRAISNINNFNKGKKQRRDTFPPELRSFAMTLQFYSSKAYNYVRKIFNLALPSPSVIRSWLSNIECEPGFTTSSFESLKRVVVKNNERNVSTLCALMLDEMAIKKQVDFVGQRTWGYEDLGTKIYDDTLKCATEVLVLMVVSINSSWKIPIGYFFITSLTGAEKANIVRQALLKLEAIGIQVTSLTCDGPNVNFNMASQLGCFLTDINNIKPYFQHPTTKENIFFIFDACHLLKILRNTFASCEIFIDDEGKKVSYKYITNLFDLQEEEMCRIGTKLRKAHMDWRKQKMKVNLAAQTISASVADAIEMLRKDFKHPNFADSEGTVRFLRLFDSAFDILNSRNPYGKGTKALMRINNIYKWEPILTEAIIYCKKLKNKDGQFLINSRNKTPFKGFIISMMSVMGIFKQNVEHENGNLKYLLTYKLSQDHLELFFLNIRSRNGWNNNPTAFQFYSNFRRLVLNLDLKDLNGNCSVLDGTHILHTTGKKNLLPINSIDELSLIRKYNLEVPDEVQFEENIISFLPQLSNLTENVVAYISGFIVRQAKKHIRCLGCLAALEQINNMSTDDTYFKLINRKNRGGLIKPSEDVIKICLIVEKKLRNILHLTNNRLPKEETFLQIFVQKTSMDIYEVNKHFSSLDDHIVNHSFYDENPKVKLIKLIVFLYTKNKLYSIGKKETEVMRGELIRKKLSKIILFSHQ